MTAIVTYFHRKDHSSSVFLHNFLSPNSPQTMFATRRIRIQNFELALQSFWRLQSFCLSELAGKYGSGQKIQGKGGQIVSLFKGDLTQ